MKRQELERKLESLGWVRDGESGTRHDRWMHSTFAHKVYVPRVHIVPSATAARILDEAEGV